MMGQRLRRRVAVVVGASGLVGGELLNRLLHQAEYDGVIALTRRALRKSPRLVEVPARFDDLEPTLAPVLPDEPAVDAFCCLGTTLSIAGSEAAFRQVDYDYVVAFGRWAAHLPVRRLIVVSALGADPKSRVFYNRVKGDAEIALRQLAGTRLVLLRPSLLDGARSERRAGEALALKLLRPVRGLLPAKVRPVRIDDVAQTMIDAARRPDAPPLIESAEMQGAAARAASKLDASPASRPGPRTS
jgi:uncharacterized protein YbjT (DUF2867 family)